MINTMISILFFKATIYHFKENFMLKSFSDVNQILIFGSYLISDWHCKDSINTFCSA